MILNRALRRAVRYFPDNTATIFDGRKQSYRELWKRAQALSKALSELGARRGDRVAIYLLNSPQFLEVVYACFEIGAVIVPLNTRLAADELVFIINDAECAAFVTDETLQPLAAAFKSKLKGIEHYAAAGGAGDFNDYETMIARHIGVEVEVVGENDLPVKPGEVGEVVARGPNVMMGYWKRPEETATALRGGWLRTGDMATIDEDGYIYLVDRKKDMIISGGENVYSTEVENVIYQHPSVREAAAIGVPDEKWGEAVNAIVTLKDGASLTESELIEFCASRLADYKVPKSVEIRASELPKSATGKILKKELREPYWQGHNRRIN